MMQEGSNRHENELFLFLFLNQNKTGSQKYDTVHAKPFFLCYQ